MKLVKTPFILTRLFPKYVWKIPNKERAVFLTFDDGPHPKITPKVLETLKKYEAKATFFCVGENAEKHPHVLKNIFAEGHAIGNHTHKHLNGYKTTLGNYIKSVEQCANYINSNLFRPPYGKITRKQGKALVKMNYRIIMWDVLSYDFDNNISQEKCANNVIKNIQPGSIIVFHDSEKAEKNMLYALEATLKYCRSKNMTSVILK